MTFKYPPIEPFATELLPVSNIHAVNVEQYGTKGAKPVLFVHGGPGGGCTAEYARFFDPHKYWIILVDQRGCGKSTPFAELEENHTQALIEDFETIRKHLHINQWMLCGGSWGSTLSLAYAEAYPNVVTEMILRGIFLARPAEIDWLFQDKPGAKTIFPEAWEHYAALVPQDERHNMLGYYYKMLTDGSEAVRLQAAKAFVQWEIGISKLYIDHDALAHAQDPQFCLPFARLEAHYLSQGAFLSPNQLLANIHLIQHIPLTIVQGRYDIVCPVQSAWGLHKAMPDSKFVVVPDAGHSTVEPGIIRAITDASDQYVDNCVNNTQ